MPELPEVETVKETLKNFIIGRKISDVIIIYDKIIKQPDSEGFKRQLKNQVFTDIRRYGKYLLFDLTDFTMVSHLRMEGKYFIRNSLEELTKHEHIVFVLDNGKYLSYHDVRKFGTMELVEKYHEKDLDSIKILGVEVNNPGLSSKYLVDKFRNRKSPIKSVLLDQSVITGLGNIYVDETLFLAKIHPLTYANELNIYQIERIIKAAQNTIDKAIELGGTTIRTYQSSLGVNGLFQNELNVHTLVSHNCKNCNDTIIKIKVGGRGTYLCPTCQRKSKPLILGLTGGIASGKSLVSKMFEEHNIKVLDADKIYKTLLKNNKIMYNELITYFGNSIIENDEINRKELGRIIFNDEKSRLMLNKITHPFVLTEMQNQIYNLAEKKVDILVLDIPLLFEARMEYLCDLIILVYTNKQNQINRLVIRDSVSEELAIKKINSQMSMSEKQLLSDIIIDNNESIKETQKQFNELLRNLRRD